MYLNDITKKGKGKEKWGQKREKGKKKREEKRGQKREEGKKKDKKDELVYSILHAAIFRLICSKLLCKSTILNPSFEKFSGGPRPPGPPAI